MYCKICNKEVENQEETYIQPKRINHTTYLVFAILTTVLCCMPLGIPAIVFAAQINGAQAAGNYEQAEACAKKVKLFTILAAVLGAVFIVGYGMLVFFGILAGAGTGGYGYY